MAIDFSNSEFDTEDDSDDGSYSCDVEQLDEHVFPLGHDNKIKAVVHGYRRNIAVIRSKDFFD